MLSIKCNLRDETVSKNDKYRDMVSIQAEEDFRQAITIVDSDSNDKKRLFPDFPEKLTIR